MKIKLKARYEISGILKGSRNPKDIEVFEDVEFIVPEFSDLDAPVATRWSDPTAIGGWRETRWFNDTHYSLATFIDYNHPDEPRLVVEPQTLPAIISSEYDRNKLFGGYLRGEHINPQSFDGLKFREADLGARDKMLNFFADFDNAIIIEGRVWKKTSEPCYKISANNRLEIVPLEKTLAERDFRRHAYLYRADRFSDALIDAGDRFEIENLDYEISIMIPESLHFDDDKLAAQKTFSYLETKIGERNISEIARTDLARLHDFFEACDVLRTEWNEDTADKMVALLSAMDRKTLHWDRDTVEHLEQRWAKRPISLDIDFKDEPTHAWRP